MSIEALNNQKENLIQSDLKELKNEIDKPWQVMYLRESSDKQYKIYKYELVQGGTKWWIKNKYINQIWPWVEWTQFTDAMWNEIKKDKFEAGEVVYLRVPKNKEKINTPWEFNFIKKYKDNQNRNRKIYSYTLKYWWYDTWIENKYYNKFWQWESLLPNRNFCDNNWNIIKTDGYFDKWETVYIRVPNRDIIDNIPEMTMSEIEKLSNNEVKKIFDSYQEFIGFDTRWNRGSRYEHADKNWDYIMINGKKLYIQYEYWNHNILKNQRPCILIEGVEGGVDVIRIWRYNWKIFHWIRYNYYDEIERWATELDDTRLR